MHAVPLSRPVVFVMVGLPARGKTYVARKLERYLRWRSVSARVFNVGTYRREHLAGQQRHGFFDPDNRPAVEVRRTVAEQALEDAVQWVRGDGQVAIFDATNSTVERRQWVIRMLDRAEVQPVFIELLCTDPAQADDNIRRTKLALSDYDGVSAETAFADFRARIAHYERNYAPLGDAERDITSIQITDVGARVVLRNVRGWLALQVLPFLLNLHLKPPRIWLTRHGQSEFNLRGRIGGDAALSPAGEAFARRLGPFLAEHIEGTPKVWCSTLVRAVQTAAALPWPAQQFRALNELDAGLRDTLTYAEIEASFPEEFAARATDKLRYRYPGGESYLDLVGRVQPLVIELERVRKPLVIIAHQAVLRTLYGYLLGRRPEDLPHLDVPLHTVLELTPRGYGFEERRHPLEAS